MATHSSILAWRIPWTEELAGYSPQGHKESDMTEQEAQHSTAHGNLLREAVFSPPALLFPINLRRAHSWSQCGRMDPQQGRQCGEFLRS